MKRYILTGAPGTGKTAILRQLELQGFGVVEEAATHLIALRQAEGIAEPWTQPRFLEDVAQLQAQRLAWASSTADTIQFHDRSLFCTLALAQYLGLPCPEALPREAKRLCSKSLYDRRFFFIRNLGFVEPTAARRITFEESLRFEGIHEDTYRQWGFNLIPIEPAPLGERVRTICATIESPTR
ncbi:MAG: AAA family ATPase [Acidobacteriota bacterium]